MAEPGPFADTHLRLLAILYVVWGGVGVLVGGAMLLLAAAAAAMAGVPPNEAGGFAARLTAASLSVLAVALVAGGLAHVWVGLALPRRRSTARLAAILLAFPDLILLPFGTLFGAYGLWVLLDDRVRASFDGTR
jgi:succinate dehydrogenase hydrophobic anchor subunit